LYCPDFDNGMKTLHHHRQKEHHQNVLYCPAPNNGIKNTS